MFSSLLESCCERAFTHWRAVVPRRRPGAALALLKHYPKPRTWLLTVFKSENQWRGRVFTCNSCDRLAEKIEYILSTEENEDYFGFFRISYTEWQRHLSAQKTISLFFKWDKILRFGLKIRSVISSNFGLNYGSRFNISLRKTYQRTRGRF